jgi:hypothetical protein
LVALERDFSVRGSGPVWLCQCDCGVRKSIVSYSLMSGRSGSCGCLRRDNLIRPRGELKRCTKCGEEKPATGEFFDGDKAVICGLRPECKQCKRKYYDSVKEQRRDSARSGRENNKERRAAKCAEWIASSKANTPMLYRAKIVLSGIKRRAKKNDVPCSITEDFLVDFYSKSETCQSCGIVFDYSLFGKRTRLLRKNPSIDRIIPSKGYIPGNLAIICYRCNTIKNDATPEEIQRVADYARRALSAANSDTAPPVGGNSSTRSAPKVKGQHTCTPVSARPEAPSPRTSPQLSLL